MGYNLKSIKEDFKRKGVFYFSAARGLERIREAESKGMEIVNIRLLEKSGGKSGSFRRQEN